MAMLRSSLSIVYAAIVAVLLAGCSVRSEPVLTSSSVTVEQFKEVTLLLEDGASVARSQFRGALISELTSRSIALTEGAAYVGDYSISSTSADVPIYASEAGQSEGEPVAVVTVRESKWTDSCAATRARATLAIYRVADGALVNRSAAEAMICDGDATPYEGLAIALIDGVTGS